MTSSRSSRIQQQMYTRERRGIFRPNEGFDTIAASGGLDTGFIKKVLHPFCVYDAPAELASLGEKDEARYPQALHLFHADMGQLVLGRSIYQAADFTGLRSAFFTHNFIVPAERAADAVKDYPSLLNADFASSYDIEQGTELPELEKIPSAAEARRPASPTALLARLGIDEKMFKQLLFAVMSSVVTRRKVFVALDVAVEELSETALQLVGVLYGSLPYAYRRALGFLTFSKEPQSRKGIHLTFVEQGSLRPNDRNIDKDYTFDLASKRVTNVDIDLGKQPYLSFAWSNLEQPVRAEAFYVFHEQMLEGMDSQRHTAIASCHELAVLFQIEEGSDSFYTQNRVGALRSMLDYLAPEGAAESKRRLAELFRGCFQREYELVKQGGTPDPAIVKCFMEYEALAGSALGSDLIGYLIRSLYEASESKGRERMEAYYALIEGSDSVSKPFFDTLLRGGKTVELFFPYMRQKFQEIVRADDLLKLAHHWSSQHPVLLLKTEFTELAAGQLAEKLRHDVEPVSAVNAVLDMADRLLAEEGRPASEDMLIFMEQLSYAANVFLLTELNLEQTRQEAFLQIGFLAHPGEVREWAARYPPHVQSTADVMLSAYRWFRDAEPDESIFDGLSPAELDRLQQLGRRWLQKDLGPSCFGRLVLAFCRDANTGLIEYGALLHYLHQHAPDKETVYRFMNWSEKQRFFSRGRKLEPGYAAAVVAYFKKYDQDAFKNRTNRKLYFEQAGAPLQAVYVKARSELSPPIVRWLRRNRKAMVWFVAILLLIGGIGGGLAASGVFDSGKPAVAGNNAADPEPETQQPAEKLEPQVYARQNEDFVDGELKPTTELVFEFGTEAECAAFQAGTITVKLEGGTEHTYTDRSVQHLCSSGAASGAGPEGTPPGSSSGAGTDSAGTTGAGAADSTSTSAEQQDQNGGGNTQSADSPDNKAGMAGGGDSAQPDEMAGDKPSEDKPSGDTSPGDTPLGDTPPGEAAPPAGGADGSAGADSVQPARQRSYQAVVSLGEEIEIGKISEVLVNQKIVEYIEK
ncbi:glycosyltransferase [Paenibacillus thiaminolyticus]|uniref:Glycosyltransferase n=2 Tax=Paenibacillus thiaminolyticus TaxID=49283 RepID=A0ABT4FYN5_PANTH|nr:glycosyltransferase [Paenibacillus thiaminolyticus]MCY9536389.1 glycosyltransferase [Paenibacillus thiaminolyticus]MCY9601401.1 glycosyltransferase [Paenibacillus thiaminolyticus]MCY9609277.1 glycosyltransferase [Paenibacillus thiaminolyticus]MCY9613056.1 glycosyltransferase [Paenibacillus thiaminolyticus]MCY9616960.1 glycosyltransferase [Paenibacillus thiaminolyticus]